MAAYFFDSSALVKFYVEETGTLWVRSFTEAVDKPGRGRNSLSIDKTAQSPRHR